MEETYGITEIFTSIQGEGRWCGRSVVFVRFAGCNLTCPWCDTNFSMREQLTGEEIATRVTQMAVAADKGIHVVFTGGEPSLQVTVRLLGDILATNKIASMAIETNGTNIIEPEVAHRLWVTCSPKQAGRFVLAVPLIDELKIVVDDTVTNQVIEQWEETMTRLQPRALLYLQPCWWDDDKVRARFFKKALDLVQSNPRWQMSFQAHKYVNLR